LVAAAELLPFPAEPLCRKNSCFELLARLVARRNAEQPYGPQITFCFSNVI
jgi:hypothetical protein